MRIRTYVKSLFIIYRYNNMLTTLRVMKNNLKLLKGGKNMLKIKEPSTSDQTEKQMIHKNIYINTFYLYCNIES